MPYRIECVLECGNHLGEGPIWDVDEGRLYWVDGTGRRVGNPSIWRLDPRTGRTETWSLGQDVGAMSLRRDGGAVLALDDGFYFFEFDERRLERIALVEADQPRTRLNDGKCDRRGRFFAGGMDDQEELKICGLYARPIGPRSRTASSAPTARAGARTIRPSTSPTRSSRSSGLTTTTSRPARSAIAGCSPPRTDDPGVADGSTVDEEGYMWNAQVIGGDLVRYGPDGSLDLRIGMPVRNVTSLTFGGDRLDEIYVTSMARVKHPAVHDLFAREVRPQFGAGHLFRVSGLGIRGLPEPRFAG